MEEIKIHLKRVREDPSLPLPRYMTQGSSGMDLCAFLPEEVTLHPGERRLIPTGIALAIPEGFEGQIRARSGWALQKGIGLVNGIGTIDSDYRGEVAVLLINMGQEPVTIRHGDRIAQLVITKVFRSTLIEVEELPASPRQEGGFGHTGRGPGGGP
ncbi:MAG: dUTP diphosphatase [Desulfobacterota bacterium]|nr:dUTP diphosphatase [Thermodesulfobacteriota bacterium]